MKKIILIVVTLLLHFNGKIMAQHYIAPFTLNGTINQTTKAHKVYLAYQYEGVKYLDSAAVVNGQFQIKGNVNNTLLVTLVLDHKGIGVKKLLKGPVDEVDALQFYLHGGNTELKLKDSASTAVFPKSITNQDYARLRRMLGINEEHKLYHLSAQMLKSPTPVTEKAYETYYDSLKKARRPVLKKFILQNPKSYIALTALMDYGGDFTDTAELRPLFKKIDQGLRNNNLGEKISMLLNSKVMVGAMAPDFTQNDTRGRPVKLSSFRGKYVLIDFWASWCHPCREDNPKWVKVYTQLKDKNFTILGISLDGNDSKAAWLKAIKDDGLTWPQVSDLKHWDNAVSIQYGIRAIPQNVLVDTQGKVMAKNIEPHEVVAIIERLNNRK
jgi:peroxiredoxin